MTQERWTEVDRYLAESLVRADPSLDAAIKASRASGLPSWDVSPTQGKLLYLIARLGGARSILEIGTLGGYSTIWLAKALPPGGQLISLEVARPRHVASSAGLDRGGRCRRMSGRSISGTSGESCQA